jgi:hypothetical protein
MLCHYYPDVLGITSALHSNDKYSQEGRYFIAESSLRMCVSTQAGSQKQAVNNTIRTQKKEALSHRLI